MSAEQINGHHVHAYVLLLDSERGDSDAHVLEHKRCNDDDSGDIVRSDAVIQAFIDTDSKDSVKDPSDTKDQRDKFSSQCTRSTSVHVFHTVILEELPPVEGEGDGERGVRVEGKQRGGRERETYKPNHSPAWDCTAAAWISLPASKLDRSRMGNVLIVNIK